MSLAQTLHVWLPSGERLPPYPQLVWVKTPRFSPGIARVVAFLWAFAAIAAVAHSVQVLVGLSGILRVSVCRCLASAETLANADTVAGIDSRSIWAISFTKSCMSHI